MRHRLSLTAALIIGLIASPTLAQDLTAQTRALQAALQENDIAKAKTLAASLQTASLDAQEYTVAGYAAFVQGGLLDSEKAYADAANAYEDCYEAYDAAGSAAQAIQCHYKSGQAYVAARQSGNAVSSLKKTARMLEDIGQDKSALASQVYLTLAEQIRPQKLERSPKARSERRQSATYAGKAIAAMEASGMTEGAELPAAYFVKGLAHEDAKDYEEAVAAYEMAVSLYEAYPNVTQDELRTIRSRLSIARLDSGDTEDNDTLDVRDADGNIITLSIKKKRKISIPKVRGNQRVDGSRVLAQITLGEGGKVSQVDILESTPTADFGEAFEKGVKRWVFEVPDGVDPTTIPPFNFSYVTYFRRR